jgi:D-ribose pyranase
VLDVVRAVQTEFHIDRVLIANEATTASAERVDELRALLAPVPLHTIDHLELKRLSREGRATIRTADTVPYANIIIVSG